MGSISAAAVLLSCVVALSMVAAGRSAGPPDGSGFITVAALKCSNISTPSSGRKLGDLPADAAPPSVDCPVRFERMRTYGRVTGRCRPGRKNMTPERCCAAFKDFACPYAELMNDLNNGCADAMFYQLIVRGKLPPGIFSSICREGPEGLKC